MTRRLLRIFSPFLLLLCGAPLGALESAVAAGGDAIVVNRSGTLTTAYTVRNHLGSTRAVVGKNGTVLECDEYYPFGQRHDLGRNYPVLASSRLKYNGKEQQDIASLSLPYLDYGARLYNPAILRWTTQDPLQEKYYGVSPFAYCADSPVLHIDADGNIWDTVWDAANVLYDLGAAAIQGAKGNKAEARSHLVDAGVDLISAAIPFVPAGTTKIAKGAQTGIKALDKATDVRGGLKKARIKEGIYFQKEMFSEMQSHGDQVAGRVRLVPLNGKGNVVGNRTDTDILIRNKDDIFTIIETKLTSELKLSKGQAAAKMNVESGNQMFEVRSNNKIIGVKKSETITVTDYIRKNKYE